MEKEIKIDGIWYLLDVDEQEAMVIKSQDKEYSNEIIIPPSFFHEGITYRVTSIGEQAFRLCGRLYSIVIPDSVIKVEPKAFEGCFELSEVHINSIESWCNIEFCGPYSNPLVNSWEASYGRNITNLYVKGEFVTKLTIPGTITTIKDGTFGNYWNLASVIIHKGVTTIGEYAFHSCHQLTSVIMPDSIIEIREGAFSGCSNLASITIPEGVTTIGERAFEDCRNLTTINLSNGVVNICNKAFNGCRNLVSIVGGSSLKSIGNSAFEECESLSSFDISDNVEFIGDGAFYGCYSLGVIIPKKLVSIGRNAFYKCWLESIIIPKSLTNIDKCAFKGCYYDCENLEIIVDESNPKYDSRENCNAIIETKSNTLIIGCDTTKIPNSVTSIGDEAFSDWSTLYSITIPHGVRSIGKGAFYICYKLCSVNIPKSITKIEESAFYGCYNLKEVNIVNLESWCKIDFGIDGNPLNNMRQYETTFLSINGDTVKDLELPNTTSVIKDYAFEGCYLKSVKIPKSIEKIGNQSFSCCCYLDSVIIPNGVKEIGKNAFHNCNLTHVILPKSVEQIEKRAFSFCDNMTYVTILGSPIIKEEAFYNCNKLRDLYCYGEDVPEVHNTFNSLDLSLITLHVPLDTFEKYLKVEPWCKFGSIVPIK